MIQKSLSYQILACLCMTSYVSLASAQAKRPAPSEVRTLDVKAEKAQADFLKSLYDLAKNYEDAGAIDKSREMLNAMLKIKPDAEAVKQKLKEFDEAVFENRVKQIDFDTSSGWTNSGVRCTQGEPVRIEATGDYKFIVNADLGPDGYDQNNLRDLVPGIATGALMGMIAPPRNPNDRGKPKEPEPFLIGKQLELNPQQSGYLFLKVNAPPMAKCVGKLKLKLSGNIAQ